jgi:hypothetical protein
VCESCGYRDHNAEICDECGSLTTCGCCRCNGTARTDSIGRRYGEPGKPWVADIKARKGFNSTRLIGFEYEFNHAQSYSQIGEACARWRAGWHTDGSCGEEVVSAPISGDHIAGCLTDLCKALRRSNAEVNSSCSMHVHVDARDFHWVDVYRLLRVYAYLEPVLYMLGGQSRVRNSYCRPVGAQYVQALRATDIKAAIMGVAFGDGAARVRQTQRSRPGKKGGVRYQGLNLLPWLAGRRSTGRHKPDTTIEFRIHRNVEPQNYNRAIHWCQTLARIVDWVAKASEKDLEALPRSPLRGLATVIAPDQKEWIIQRVREWRAATSFSRDRLRLRRYQPRHFTVRGGMGFTFAPTWAHLRALDPLKNPIVLRSQILTRATPKQTKIKQRAA